MLNLAPEAVQALQAVNATLELPQELAALVHVRASQLNSCNTCLAWSGQPADRLAAVAEWRTNVTFTEKEKAALALTEAVTHLPVPDAVWEEAARHYPEKELASLVLQIGLTNLWNRLNVRAQ